VLENIIWLSQKYNQKYVGFMAPLAKKFPNPWVRLCTRTSSAWITRSL